MEVRVYNRDLQFKGLSENQSSILWTRRYNSVGEFEIHLPITPFNVDLYQINNLVWMKGELEAGVIEDIHYDESLTSNDMVVSGRFLESYMDRRVIHPTVNFNGKTEVAMRQLLDDISPVIPYVQLGELQGFDEEVSFQCLWKDLLAFETKLAQSSNLGFRFRPDFTNKNITFEIYKGLDKTRSQSDRNFVEFSDDFDNVNQATYIINDQLEKTVAYVAGQGEGEDRVVVVVGDDTLIGYNRREIFIDAKDLSPEGLSQAEYEAVLTQRGIEKMTENMLSSSFECVIIPIGNFVYKTDYDLGDIVTVKKSNWNITQDLRITEIMEVYEEGEMQVIPTLGDPLPTTFEMED